jgi:hypothetical protein
MCGFPARIYRGDELGAVDRAAAAPPTRPQCDRRRSTATELLTDNN